MDINWKNTAMMLGTIIGIAIVWATIAYIAQIPNHIANPIGCLVGMPVGLFAVLRWPPVTSAHFDDK